jgi:hypothetical protein
MSGFVIKQGSTFLLAALGGKYVVVANQAGYQFANGQQIGSAT